MALVLLAFTYWAAQKVLVVHPTPQDRPPKVVAMPPAKAFHNGHDGYVISVRLSADKCSEPVRGSMMVVLPSNFFTVERQSVVVGPPLRSALFGVAFSDPGVEVTHIGPTRWEQGPTHTRSWAWPFSNPVLADDDGLVAVARLDDWSKKPTQLEVSFTADWLRPKGYGSCWLATPELVGDLRTFTVNASDAINETLGAESGADPVSYGGSSSTMNAELESADGTLRKYHIKSRYKKSYASFTASPALGFVSLETPMSIVSSESVGTPPTVGPPTWSCRETGGGPAGPSHFLGLDGDGVFSWNESAALSEYLPEASHSGCDGWVALVESGSQTRRDLWLLVIGATLSAGIALLIDAALHRRGREKKA
jgi:hypothetical protein